MNYLFLQIMKVVKCTSRGQVTLPKKWRDEIGTDHLLVVVTDDGVTFKPIIKKEFMDSVEEGWQRYLNGAEGYISHEDLKKEYGL